MSTICKLILIAITVLSTFVFAGSPPTPTNVRVNVVKKNKFVPKRLRRANMYSTAKENGSELVIGGFGLDLFFDDGDAQNTNKVLVPDNHIERVVDEICVSKGYHYDRQPKQFLGVIGRSQTIIPKWQPVPSKNGRVAITVYAADAKAIATHWWTRNQFLQVFGTHTRFHILNKVICKMYPAKWEPHSYYADTVKGLKYEDVEHMVEKHNNDYGTSTVVTDIDSHSSIEPFPQRDLPMGNGSDKSPFQDSARISQSYMDNSGDELPEPQPLSDTMYNGDDEDEGFVPPGNFLNR